MWSACRLTVNVCLRRHGDFSASHSSNPSSYEVRLVVCFQLLPTWGFFFFLFTWKCQMWFSEEHMSAIMFDCAIQFDPVQWFIRSQRRLPLKRAVRLEYKESPSAGAVAEHMRTITCRLLKSMDPTVFFFNLLTFRTVQQYVTKIPADD